MHRRGSAGFSLLENVIALAIVTVGLLGTTRLFGEALRSLRDHQHRQSATVLGEDLIEQLIALREQSLLADRDCTLPREACFDDAPAQAQLEAWQARVRRLLPDAAARLIVAGTATTIRIELGIEWRDSRGERAATHFERVLRR